MKSALAVLPLFLAASLALAAADPGSIVVKSVAEKEEVVTAADGTKTTRLVPLAKAVPGDEVVYTVTVQNVGKEPATDVVVTNPVPEHTRYVAGSAGGPGTEVAYSVDGGRTWGRAEELKVREADGTLRPATPADYTHVRFVMKNALTPGSVAFARYRVAIK